MFLAMPYRWFGRDAPAGGWSVCAAARPSAWRLPERSVAAPQRALGPFASETEVWRAIGALDEAAGPVQRSIVLPRSALEDTRAGVSRILGVEVGWSTFLALWRCDLLSLGATAPGQARADAPGPTVGEALAGGPPILDRVAAEVPGVAVDEVTVAGAPYVVAQVRVEGGCWLRCHPPFAYYGALGSPLRGDANPDRPELPGELAQAVLADERPATEVIEAALARLPTSPSTWRSDFWLDILDAATPADLACAVGCDEARIQLFAESLAGTALFGPLLAAVGEWILLDKQRPFSPAEAAAWAVADPAALAPSRRAAAVALQARGLFEAWAVELFCTARDRLGGSLDLRHPAVEALVVRPLREALLSPDPDGRVVVGRLRGLYGAGGPDAVRDVLEGLVAEGTATPSDVVRLARGLGEPDASSVAPAARDSVAASFSAPMRYGEAREVVHAMQAFRAQSVALPEVLRALLRHPSWHVPLDDRGRQRLVNEDGALLLAASVDPPHGESARLDGRSLVRGLPPEAEGIAFDPGSEHAVSFRRAQLPTVLEWADALDLEQALLHPGPGQAGLLAGATWRVLRDREGRLPVVRWEEMLLVPLFTAPDAVDRFLMREPSLASRVQVGQAGGPGLFAELARREDHDGLVINPSFHQIPPVGPDFAAAMLAGVDPRPGAGILPARTVAEIYLWLDLLAAERAGRRHTIEQRPDGLAAVYEATFPDGRRKVAFALTEPTADPEDLGEGPSRILCAGLLAVAVDARLGGLPDNPRRLTKEDRAKAAMAARWLWELEKMLEGGDRLPRTAVRTAFGARMLREHPELATRAWVEAGRRRAEAYAGTV